jgi:hypothetical protein
MRSLVNAVLRQNQKLGYFKYTWWWKKEKKKDEYKILYIIDYENRVAIAYDKKIKYVPTHIKGNFTEAIQSGIKMFDVDSEFQVSKEVLSYTEVKKM